MSFKTVSVISLGYIGLSTAAVIDVDINQQDYEKMSRSHNPYGDGEASSRIIASLVHKSV